MLTVLDSTLRAALAAAATQADQAAAVVAAFGGGSVTVRSFNSGGTLVMTTVHGAPVADASTPRGWSLGAVVRGSTVWHVSGQTIARSVYRNASAVDVYSLDAADLTPTPLVVQTGRHHRRGERSTARASLPVNGLPSWMQSTSAQWLNITGSALTSSGAGWSGTSPGGSSNYQAIVNAWGGGILNTVGVYRAGSFVAGIFLVIFGGGHGDYAGNELYAFGPLGGDSPMWSRITDPTVPGPDNVNRSGGYPVSRHTYDTLVYLPTTNQMLCIGAPGYHSLGFTYNICDIFDFDTNPTSNPWSTADASFPAYNGGGTGAIDLVSGYNPATGYAWGLGRGNAQRLGRFDVAAGTWSSWAIDAPASGSGLKGAIDPGSDLLVYVTGGNPYAVDLRTPTASVYSPTDTGTGPAGRLVIEWDAAAGRFVGWTGTGKAVYFLTPGANPYSGGDSWAWTSDTPAGGDTPATETANGTYSRARLVVGDGWRGLLVMPSATANLSFYRIA